MRKTKEYLEFAAIILIFLGILSFIFSYIPLDLIFLKTVTAGGDTASHYYPAYYLKNYLIKNFDIVGWSQGWYAGIPMFQFYFPLPFILMVFLSYIFSLEIAFKIVTLLAIILIPFGAYFFFRLMDFSRQISAIASVFTLPFLFMEANSMWGGNIPSTFAGEFTYAIGLALSLVYLGLMYKGINSGKHLIKNSILLTLIGLSHVYTLLWVVVTSLFLLVTSDFKRKFFYWFKVNFIAFLLLAFWLIPLIYYLKYTTPYTFKWIFTKGLKEVFPAIFWPFYALTFFGIILGIINRDKRFFYILFSIIISAIFYYFSSNIGVVDIRFLPFIQLLLLFIAVLPFNLIYKTKLKRINFIPLIIFFIVVIWTANNVTYIGHWAKWNYEGFERKSLWLQYSGVNDFLKGTVNDSRVVYEHSSEHDKAGTTRAYESLPLFSGRSTLEGLYMQSSPSSPFIFYIQSEISKEASCPFPNWKCTSFNLENGTKHLKLFNAGHFVAISDKAKDALRNNSEYELVYENNPYEVYELKTNENSYVTIPKYEPLFFPRKNWRERSYELFKDDSDLTVIFDESIEEEQKIIKKPIKYDCKVNSLVKEEEIYFTTNCIGIPHLIKISYFPRWKVEGAEKVYLASPSFMLVYPERENVRLYFGNTWIEYFAMALTLIGLILIIFHRKIMIFR